MAISLDEYYALLTLGRLRRRVRLLEEQARHLEKKLVKRLLRALTADAPR